MKKTIFLPILCLLAFVALITVTSCEKSPPVTESEPVELDQNSTQAQADEIFQRIRNSTNPQEEIRKINEEKGRYVDEKGDVYFNRESFTQIQEAKSNPNARSTTYYNSWYNPTNDWAVVWYYDNGNYNYFATLGVSEAFVTLPSGWDVCSNYNEYQISIAMNGPWGVPCTVNCCGNSFYGRFWAGSTILDQDNFAWKKINPGVNDWWFARIRNAYVTPPFRQFTYVLNGYNCHGHGCQAGNCPGPLCGFFD